MKQLIIKSTIVGSLLLLQSATSYAAQCGATNQRPCKVWERVPSCNRGLAEDFRVHKCVRKKQPRQQRKQVRRTVVPRRGQRKISWTAPRWMATLSPYIRNKHLSQIVIPGTHDAGAFSSHLSNSYVRTQSRDLGQQLNDGIRYLNLELTVNKNNAVGFKRNAFYFSHSAISATNMKVRPQLIKIRNFADRHPKELIILDFQELSPKITGAGLAPGSDFKSNMAVADQKRIARMVGKIFDKRIIKSNQLAWLKKSTIGQLQAKSQANRNNPRIRQSHNIIVLWNYNGPSRSYPTSPTQFIKRGDFLHQVYNTGSQGGAPELVQVRGIINGIRKELPIARPGKVKLLPFCLNSTNMHGSAVHIGIKNAKYYVTRWRSNPRLKRNVNIVMVDFYHEAGFVKRMINLNRR